MLRNLMTDFDKECLKRNLYKVYTIGDCYVIMGIIDINNRNISLECKNVIDMALEMLEIIKRVKERIGFSKLNMRIGAHSGTFFGGVIGTDIVRYDIFGLDVMIANKMESNGIK